MRRQQLLSIYDELLWLEPLICTTPREVLAHPFLMLRNAAAMRRSCMRTMPRNGSNPKQLAARGANRLEVKQAISPRRQAISSSSAGPSSRPQLKRAGMPTSELRVEAGSVAARLYCCVLGRRTAESNYNI